MGLSGLRGGRVEVAGKLAIDNPNGRSYALDMVAIELAQEEKLMALAHQIDVLQVQFAREASDYAASWQYEVDGFTTAIGWLRFNCHMSSNAAANSVCVGENLDRLSDSLEKVYSSELGYAHLVVLARTADDVGDAFNEHDLLPQAPLRTRRASFTFSAGTTGTRSIQRRLRPKRPTWWNSAP